ncbi:hypothetical protein QBC46DRAFT_348273 [Diplogelasinospora grovesii]|uniref:Uncharacterized protein n=1 Tax=Diplogelasinospora grovesii TaxID=303347 RepID=A0AAN6MWY8_9PEZI|nr:hypothetical protein QBC46DRAFT_348273 [Diplogelasinospora grovesii]
MVSDLEEAIRVARQAVDSMPDDHADRAGWLSNLGSKLERRYERTGEMSDPQTTSTSTPKPAQKASSGRMNMTPTISGATSAASCRNYRAVGPLSSRSAGFVDALRGVVADLGPDVFDKSVLEDIDVAMAVDPTLAAARGMATYARRRQEVAGNCMEQDWATCEARRDRERVARKPGGDGLGSKDL